MAVRERQTTCCGESVTLRYDDRDELLGGENAWEHWPHLVRRGELRATYHGPATYGDVTVSVVEEPNR